MSINALHTQTLTQSAIDTTLAEHYGIRSIDHPDELPEGCEGFLKHIPGLLFPLPDPNGDLLYQIRADTPPPGSGKYITPDGTNPQLIVWPMAKAILDSKSYNKVLIVEGTKQSLAATATAPKGALVVGITGCWNWKSTTSDTGVVEGLDEIVDGKAVFVCFDADIRTNGSVHSAASSLDKTLRLLGANVVKWVILPDGDKTGLDDRLGKTLPNMRAKELSALMSKASAGVPRLIDPTEPELKSGQIVPDEERLSFERVRIMKEFVSKDTVLNALVRVVKARSIVSDIVSMPDRPAVDGVTQLGTELVLEVKSSVFTPGKSYEITVSRDSILDLESWFSLIPDAGSIQLKLPTSKKEATEIVNAITEYRAAEREGETVYTRLGWIMHDGVPSYMFNGGAVTQSGNTTSIQASLTGAAANVKFPDVQAFSKSELQKAIRRSLAPMSFLHRPELWGVLVGGLMYASAGFEPRGILYLYGHAGSGKTHLAQGATAFLSPEFGPSGDVMATLEGTTNAAMATTPPYHNSMILFDDAHPVTGKVKQAAQADMLDTLARVGYSGGSASIRRAHWSKEKGVVQAGASSREHPFIVITAEFQPLRESDARSFFERTFIVQVSEADTYKSLAEMEGEVIEGFEAPVKGADAMTRIAKNGDLNLAMSGFLANVAKNMMALYAEFEGKYNDPISCWLAEAQKSVVSNFEHVFRGDSTRLSENTRAYLVGMVLYLAYAVEEEAITLEEANALSLDFADSLRALKDFYSDHIIDKNDFGFGQLLNSIKVTVASGDAIIVGLDDNEYTRPYATVVGRYIPGRGYAIMAKPLSKALHTDESQIKQVLSTAIGVQKHVFRLAHSNEEGRRPTVRGYLINEEVWDDATTALRQESTTGA
jgi:hypothetical protein